MRIKQCSSAKICKKGTLGLAVLAMLGVTGQAQAQSALSINTGEVTYADHVAQIITDNCVVCHHEGGGGPMQLTNYEQVRPWAPLVQYRVENREMPPYAYDHGIGIHELQGDWRLEQSEIDIITAWVQQGAQEGDWSDRCIKAIQVKPAGNAKAVVHHANSYVETLNEEGEPEFIQGVKTPSLGINDSFLSPALRFSVFLA